MCENIYLYTACDKPQAPCVNCGSFIKESKIRKEKKKARGLLFSDTVIQNFTCDSGYIYMYTYIHVYICIHIYKTYGVFL